MEAEETLLNARRRGLLQHMVLPGARSGEHRTTRGRHDETLTGLFIKDAIIKPGKKP